MYTKTSRRNVRSWKSAFSRMRSKGSRFTLGVCGWRCVRLMLSNRPHPSATVRNRSQPFATARNRLCDWHMAVPIGSFPGGVIFGRFTCHVALFRVAGVILLRCFQNMHYIFAACAALWACPASFFVAGAAFQTCLVASFWRIALAGLRKEVTKCKLRGRCGLVKTPRKTLIVELQLVKIEGETRTKCLF